MNCLYTALCDLAAERQTPGRCVCPGFIIDETIVLGVPSRCPSPSGSHGNISGSRRVCSGLRSDSRALQETDNLSKLSRVRSHRVMHFTNRDCETAPWQLWGGCQQSVLGLGEEQPPERTNCSSRGGCWKGKSVLPSQNQRQRRVFFCNMERKHDFKSCSGQGDPWEVGEVIPWPEHWTIIID